MKGAAKCDKHCELQDSVNQQGLERTLRFRDIPESMPTSVSISFILATPSALVVVLLLQCACALERHVASDALSAWGFLHGTQLAKHLACNLLLCFWGEPLHAVCLILFEDMKLGQQTR